MNWGSEGIKLNNFKFKNIVIILITLFVFLVSIMGGQVEYAINDDVFRNLISVGAFGDKYSYYIPYSNVLYGIPLYGLSKIAPGINWYYWLMLGLDVIAVMSICLCLLKKSNVFFAAFITVIINISLARDFYIVIQFTKSGSLWMVAGAVIFFSLILAQDHKWIWGILLFLYGVSCRIHCFYMLLPFLALWVLVFLLNCQKQYPIDYKRIRKRLFVLGVSVVVVISSEYVYRFLNPEWSIHWEYDAASAKLLDHMYMEYEHDEAAYDLINTNRSDLELYKNWIYGDLDFYDLDWLKNVARIENKHNETEVRFDPVIIYKTIIAMVEAPVRLPIECVGIIALTYLMVIVQLTDKSIIGKLFALANLGGLYGITYYFVCVNRLMWRAECGVYLAVVAFLMLYRMMFVAIEDKEVEHIGVITAVCALVTVIIVGSYSANMAYQWWFVKDRQLCTHYGDISGRLMECRDDKDSIYLLTEFYVTNNPLDITRAKWEGLYENSIYLGGWLIPSPIGLYYAREHGISNPMLELVNSDKAFLCSNNPSMVNMIEDHLSKVMGEQITFEMVGEGLWKVKSDE